MSAQQGDKNIEAGQFWKGRDGEVFHVLRRHGQEHWAVDRVSSFGECFVSQPMHEDSFSREITPQQAEIIALASCKRGIRIFLKLDEEGS